jgi:glycosyltransferase involved in cell wall biosynthesis
VTLWASGDSTTSADRMSVVPHSLRVDGLCDDGLQYSLLHVAMALRDAREFDIVHSHNGPPAELGMALSHMIYVPMLTTLHNPLRDDGRFIWSNYRGWYNTISHQQHLTQPELPLAKYAGTVHNGIDVESFPFRPEKDGYFLFIGRITPEKGPHLAVEVARRLGVKLVIAGKVAIEEEQRYFEETIKPLLDGRHAEFVGEASASLKRELYAGARALLMPLQWDEPFGLVMIEAMACGTPAIVFRRGAAPEIVRDGETGFLVQDVDGMVEAVKKLDKIDPWRCREHVAACFSPSAMADSYLAVYEKMLGVKESLYDQIQV